MNKPIRIFIDFDGTVAHDDTTDLLLERFAEPSWQAVEAAWERGEIGSRDCMLRQIDLLRARPAELDALLSEVSLDETFKAFVESCASRGLPVTVVSDGLDRSVKAALARLELDLPVMANELVWTGDASWRLSFPYAREDCRALAGHCKCQSLKSAGTVRVLIGDGRSDFCAAATADMVFAKGKLADHCRAARIRHQPFTTFADLQPRFERWLAGVTQPLTTSAIPLWKDTINAD